MVRRGIRIAGLAVAFAGDVSAGDPPAITRHPVSQRVIAGHTTRLIGGTSNVAATFAWEVDGTRAAGASTTEWLVRNALPGTSTHHFVARNPHPAAGAPAVGESVSRPARLSILMPPQSPGIVDLAFADPGPDEDDVRAIIPLDDGGAIVAGDFTTLDGQPTGRIASLRPDGTRNPAFLSHPGADDRIRAIVRHGDGWILGGEFSSFHGLNRSRLVRLQPNGEVDPAYRPPSLPPAAVVHALAIQKSGTDNLLVAGLSAEPWLIRLNPDGTIDRAFSSRIAASGLNGQVSALAVQPDGRIVLGGVFSIPSAPTPASWPFHRIGRLLPDGQPDVAGFVHGESTGADLEVRAVAIAPGGGILLGGRFNTVHGQRREHAARLLPNGAIDLNFHPVTNGDVHALAVGSSGDVYLAGDFSRVGGVSIRSVARLTPTGINDPEWHPAGFNGEARTLALGPDNRVFVGGEFSQPHAGVVALRGLVPPTLPRVLSAEDPQILHAGEGGSLVLSAEASPEATFAWFRDGKLLGLTQSGEWMIPIVGPEDAGVYSVIVTTELGAAPPAVFSARVQNRSPGDRPLARALAPALPAVIPNFGTLDSRIPMPPLHVEEVRVTIALDHEDTNDLDLHLIAPNGSSVPLALTSLRRGRNFDFTVFAEHAPASIDTAGSSHIGTFRPVGNTFSNLTGEQPAGDWILRVIDTDPGTATGTLRFFALDLFSPLPTVTKDFFQHQPLPPGRLSVAWNHHRQELSIAHWRPAAAVPLAYHLGSTALDWSTLSLTSLRTLRVESDQSAFATLGLPVTPSPGECFLRVHWP
jgi:subtilisin-like proprotein convertase family protein